MMQYLSDVLKAKVKADGIYRRTQLLFCYNSNAIEGSLLSYDEVCRLFDDPILDNDDEIETVDHFRCFDLILDNFEAILSEKLIKSIHKTLESSTDKASEPWFSIGDYKRLENEVGGMDTASPEEVSSEMKSLLEEYNSINEKSLDDILDFHVRFERIHPFQDGNGRGGRLIMFKECLKHDIVPFIIEDRFKMFYYRGLKEWNNTRAFLRDTCLAEQDIYKGYLDYFRISY